MRLLTHLTALLPLAALLPASVSAVNILLTNDDGWAEINVRALYNVLTAAGDSVVLAAPAENESGTGSSTAPPSRVGPSGCEFSSCPPNSPATGSNTSQPRLTYVNSYPATAVSYGLTTLAPQFFGGLPALVVAGPNVGNNLGATTLVSGTVGAATYAASGKYAGGSGVGVPAVAFSGDSGSQTAWDVSPVPGYASLYAEASTALVDALVGGGGASGAYLPQGVYLNVNFPAAGSGTSCASAAAFKFVLSRINPATSSTPPDVQTCGSTRLPTESTVVGTRGGCYASVSVGSAASKGDSTAANQAVVLGRLGGLLGCLP